MSLKGVLQGLDSNNDPIPGVIVLCPAVATAAERMLPLLAQYPYLLQTGLALNKYGHYPCPCPVTEDFSFAISRR